MKKLLIGLLMISFLVSEETEIGRYKVEVTTYTSKKGNMFVLETVIDTKTGKVMDRKRFFHTEYGKKKK
tara:strand:- start:86 stop:292 length:207 start_codon:yes stop_codon:yes gene_type:complete